MTKNKILTSINGELGVQVLGLVDQYGNPVSQTVLEGIPLGTSDQSSTGELAIKAIIIADRSTSPSAGFGIPPYDTITTTYYGSTNNVQTQVFSLNSVTVRTLTYTYAGGGSANNDLVTVIAAS